MLVVLHASQLEHIIEKTLIKIFTVHPEEIKVDNRYYVKAQNDWEVSANFVCGGRNHRIEVNIDPETGEVRHFVIDDPPVA